MNMSSHDDKMLAVLRDAGIVPVEWRMSCNNDEGDLGFVDATYSDGSRCPLPDEVREKLGPGSLWHLAEAPDLSPTSRLLSGYPAFLAVSIHGRTTSRFSETHRRAPFSGPSALLILASRPSICPSVSSSASMNA
jgi:hypothetical protein